ncbi:uncharacterized protein LOC132628815 [Lycium barbarum]|uniref:uncharacterized protein LOC132628815 n=1 Tax=Lycium barbarum TaxID=112863 RepID=UPI00293F661C|nr:uncharacterized protein LOC132628815 [Lycium barbarum]
MITARTVVLLENQIPMNQPLKIEEEARAEKLEKKNKETKINPLKRGNKRMVTPQTIIMISALFWSIRGVRSKKRPLIDSKILVLINNIQFVAIFEPFVAKQNIDGYRKFLGYQHCLSNLNGKIWCFCRNFIQADLISENDQHVIINMKKAYDNQDIFISAIYAKCTAAERRDLWDSLEEDSLKVDGPWCIEGDFNVILDPTEKYGALTSNGANCTIRHLARTGSDHKPLSMKYQSFNSTHITYFREQIGDLYENASKWEAKLQTLVEIDIQVNTDQSRHEVNRAHAEYIQWMKLQDSILVQKSQGKYFGEGDGNTRYFHSILRETRRTLILSRIKIKRGKWIRGDEKISRAAVKHFHSLFNLPHPSINSNILLCVMPDGLEIKEVVFSLSALSFAGSNGYNGTFFRAVGILSKRTSLPLFKISLEEKR